MGVAGALLEAAARGDAARLSSILKADARDVNVTDEVGRSALQRAAAEGHVRAVLLLLQHGADPNKQDNVYGNTAAHEAAWKGYSATLQGLGRHGADLRLLNHAGFTPLHFACQNGHNQSCRELLLAGAPPDLQNTYGDSALHTAARYGHAGVTRILLSAQCGVSLPNRNGDSALHIAAAMGRRKLTRILLDAGADRHLRNHQRETPRDIATRKGLAEILAILDAPASKRPKKKRDKSKERALDEPDAPRDRSRVKDKKKKNVRFEPPEPAWSPYGCHYHPDPAAFPQPRLESLPAEPLARGEQYYLDLAGNIRKGPAGAARPCYCAPLLERVERTLQRDAAALQRRLDRAQLHLTRRVGDLELRTRAQLADLTRALHAERQQCRARHQRLQLHLQRGGGPLGAVGRASERVRRLDAPPLKRTRSLELLDANELTRVHEIIDAFNRNSEEFGSNAGDLRASQSSETLSRASPPPPRPARSTEALSGRATPPGPRAEARSPVRIPPNADVAKSREPSPAWRSRVLQRTSDDIKKRADLEREMAGVAASPDSKSLDISQDGYVRLRKHQPDEPAVRESRKSVQEIVAQVERQGCISPDSTESPKKVAPTERVEGPPPPPQPPHPSILKMPQQPLRPAPILKEKPPKSKRFSLHNLIPFPTRKTFQPPPPKDPNDSESSDEEDNPIRSSAQPGAMRNTSLLQTLPMPNYDSVLDKAPSPSRPAYPADCRPIVPKDAYFHEIPNRQMPYRDLEAGPRVPRQYDYNQPGLPEPQAQPRSRNPLYQQPRGAFEAMMQEHVLREMERMPRCYSERLDPNTEVEIADRLEHCRGYCEGGEHALSTRLHSLAINTHLSETHSQTDRESHNDSGYSTKVYGSSHGPSPTLSADTTTALPNGKPLAQLGGSSLV